jgi:hypothetical protein
VLLIGHEPGLGGRLRGPAGALGRKFTAPTTNFIPAALAVVEADIDDWAGFDVDAVRIVAFKTPRGLISNQVPGA